MADWFIQTPETPNRGKNTGTQLPSDIMADIMSDDMIMIWNTIETDMDRLANNR
jgi:hypothetical protein